MYEKNENKQKEAVVGPLMLSLYCKAIKLLPRTVDVLSILVLLCRSYAPLLLILQLSIARPFQNKSNDSASAEEVIDLFYLNENY